MHIRGMNRGSLVTATLALAFAQGAAAQMPAPAPALAAPTTPMLAPVMVPNPSETADVLWDSDAIARLKPGQFHWAEAIAPEGPVLIIVSLPLQRAFIYRNGVRIGVTTVSTGRAGHLTPTGTFPILAKDANHVSNKYKIPGTSVYAPMRDSQRLTRDGIFLHAGKVGARPNSHGCVHLPAAFARTLFAITTTGATTVDITDTGTMPLIATTAPLLDNDDAAAPGPAGNFTWSPTASPTGPLTIVISGADRRLVVLRDGIEIGSSDITTLVPITDSQAFTLNSADAQGRRWLHLPIPGDSSAGALPLADARLPPAFRSELLAVLVPGTTLLVTPAPLSAYGRKAPVR